MIKIDTTPDGILPLISKGENKWVELKSQLPPDDIISREIVGFANSDGGIVIFGVGAKGTIQGIPDSKVFPSLDRLITQAKTLLPLPAEIGSVIIHGRTLLYMIVPSAPEEYRPLMTSRGEIFKRTGGKSLRFDIVQNQSANSLEKHRKYSEQIAFVAMSFREEEEPALSDYYAAMERAVVLTLLPIKLKRIDLMEGDYEISQQIMEEIDKASILIADFTLSAKNVYFELGYARGKNSLAIIQTARNGTSLEFDVRNWKTIFYKNATELEKKLVPALSDAFKRASKMKER